MSDISYANYSYPNTPFVFDKIYASEVSLKTDDGVFPTRYVLVETNNNGEKAVVYQKIIGNNGFEYKKIAVLDYSTKAIEQVNDVLKNYKVNEDTGNIFLVWNDLDAQQEATTE